MNSSVSILAASAVAALTLTAVSAPSATGTGAAAQRASAPGVVTRAEFNAVRRDMSRAKVERVFGAGRGCTLTRFHVDGVRTVTQSYRNAAGSFTQVEYEARRGHPLRTSTATGRYKTFKAYDACPR